MDRTEHKALGVIVLSGLTLVSMAVPVIAAYLAAIGVD
jgi:hypothetical protein